LALLGVGVAPGLVTLAASQLVFGAATGALDVTMNAHAVAVERALGRHIMNGCHAAWSIGAVVGSLLGSGAAHLGAPRPLHYGLLVVLVLPALLACGRLLLPARVDRAPDRRTASAPEDRTASAPGRMRRRTGWRAGWTPRVLGLGAMGATVLTVEAAVATWSGVFLHDRGASLGAAALGYAAFAVCQTAGRLVGDRLLARGSAAGLLRTGAVLAAVGIALVVLSPWPALGIAGFAVVGVGMATPLPVLFGVVGHLGAGTAETAAGAAVLVARFTTLTYAGILLGPAVIGWTTEGIGLTWTLAGLIPALAVVAVGARAAGRVRA
jgi:fucose permease